MGFRNNQNAHEQPALLVFPRTNVSGKHSWRSSSPTPASRQAMSSSPQVNKHSPYLLGSLERRHSPYTLSPPAHSL